MSKLNHHGNQLLFSSYFGGGGRDVGAGIALHPSDNIYLIGTTGSANFPIKRPLQPHLLGFTDGFVAKISLDQNDQSMKESMVLENNPGLPDDHSLFQNYPNPFLSAAKSRLAGNPETEIRFAIPEASHIVVKIFNIVGEEIRTLVDEPREAGYHRVHWDGKDKNGKAVASGIYLYQLRAGDPSTGSGQGFSQVKKMSLLR